jgi:hypothetical protein
MPTTTHMLYRTVQECPNRRHGRYTNGDGNRHEQGEGPPVTEEPIHEASDDEVAVPPTPPEPVLGPDDDDLGFDVDAAVQVEIDEAQNIGEPVEDPAEMAAEIELDEAQAGQTILFSTATSGLLPLQELTVAELRAQLTRYNDGASGNKGDLQARLSWHVNQNIEDPTFKRTLRLEVKVDTKTAGPEGGTFVVPVKYRGVLVNVPVTIPPGCVHKDKNVKKIPKRPNNKKKSAINFSPFLRLYRRNVYFYSVGAW